MKTYHIEVCSANGSVWFTAQDRMNDPSAIGRAAAEEIYYKLLDQFKNVSLIETETSERPILSSHL